MRRAPDRAQTSRMMELHLECVPERFLAGDAHAPRTCALRRARAYSADRRMRARPQVWLRDDWNYAAMTLCRFVSLNTGALLMTTSRARSPAHLARTGRASAEADMMPFWTASRRALRGAHVDTPQRRVRLSDCAADTPPAPRPRALPRLAAPPKAGPRGPAQFTCRHIQTHHSDQLPATRGRNEGS